MTPADPRQSEQAHRPPGRPRSQRSTAAVLHATAELLATRGLGGLTMQQVARDAGVSTATVYRWWPSRGALVLDVLLHLGSQDIPLPNTGDLHTDLSTHLHQMVARFRDTNDGQILAALLAEAQHDPATGAAIRDRWLATRRGAARQRLEAARQAGQLRNDLDLDVLLDIIYGPIYYRLLAGHAPLDNTLADHLAGAIRMQTGAEQ